MSEKPKMPNAVADVWEEVAKSMEGDIAVLQKERMDALLLLQAIRDSTECEISDDFYFRIDAALQRKP